MIDVVLHNRTASHAWGPVFFRRVANAAAPYLDIPQGHTGEVGIALIGSVRMRAMNRKYRGNDTGTDVLSFPLSTPRIKGYTYISLGDLFISLSDVAANAALAGHSMREQMTWTIVHGLLHLVGYSHSDRRMSTAESKILRVLLSHNLRD